MSEYRELTDEEWEACVFKKLGYDRCHIRRMITPHATIDFVLNE